MPSQISNATVRVEGLRELLRSLDTMHDITPREVKDELVKIGKIVADRAEHYAIGERLVDSHQLIDSFKVSASAGTGTVAVRNTARRASKRYPSGYRYPARYEFENGGARSFMRPAVQRTERETERRMGALVDRLAARSGFGGAL
jgi:hypothetical protein